MINKIKIHIKDFANDDEFEKFAPSIVGDYNKNKITQAIKDTWFEYDYKSSIELTIGHKLRIFSDLTNQPQFVTLYLHNFKDLQTSQITKLDCHFVSKDFIDIKIISNPIRYYNTNGTEIFEFEASFVKDWCLQNDAACTPFYFKNY